MQRYPRSLLLSSLLLVLCMARGAAGERRGPTTGTLTGKARPVADRRPPPPPRQPPLPARYRGYTLTRRNARLREKVIALTFDDGPNPQITPQVLAALQRYNARATFFVLGQWAQEWPQLVRQEAAAGHAVASHSYSHPPGDLGRAQARRELDRTAEVLEQLTGTRPQLFRPPFGRLDGSLSREATRLDYCLCKWTICGSDKPNQTVSDIVHRVTQNPVSGDIVLLHDGRSHIATVRALPELLRRLRARGFSFVTVPRLLQLWDATKPPARPAPPRRPPAPAPGGTA